MSKPLRLLALLAVATLAITACKGTSSTSIPPGGFPPIVPGGDRAQWVGIGDLGTSCANGNTTTSQIENWSLGSNAVPLSGNLTPNARYGNNATTKVDSPYGWFVDNNGNEWIANGGLGVSPWTGASVIETSIDKNGTTAPSKTITYTGFEQPSDIYVSQSNGVNNWIYVMDDVANAIFIFPATASGATTPSYTITNTASPYAFDLPFGLSLDKNGNIWVANQLNNSIEEFSNPTSLTPGTYNESPTEVITGSSTTLSLPNRVYLDSHSNIWTSNFGNNSITEFAASSGSGVTNEAPLVTIAGSNTGLSGPIGVAVDNGGNVYSVSKNSANPAIEIWWANTIQAGTNNVAPTYTIAGSNTHLLCPASIQVYSISGTNDV